MADTPLTPFNPFADSPQESTPNSTTTATVAEAIPRRAFSFNTPPPPPPPLTTTTSSSRGATSVVVADHSVQVQIQIQIRSQFHHHDGRHHHHHHDDDDTGSLYTTGLNAQALPELIAQGVPRHRAPLVVKNLHFLAGRMLQGIPVRAGHRSTDHDYRVAIVAPPAAAAGGRPSHNTLTLIPFYTDCEEWGSFPPAPQQDRTRRNRLLAAAWFPSTTNHDQDSFDETDAKYLVDNVQHFERLLQLPDLARINATLPIALQQLVHCHISQKILITPISPCFVATTAATPTASTATTTMMTTTTMTTTATIMQNHFPAPSPLSSTKRSALVVQQDQSNIPKKKTTVEKPRSTSVNILQQQQPHHHHHPPARSHIMSIMIPPSLSSSSSSSYSLLPQTTSGSSTIGGSTLYRNDYNDDNDDNDDNTKNKNDGVMVVAARMFPSHHDRARFSKENELPSVAAPALHHAHFFVHSSSSSSSASRLNTSGSTTRCTRTTDHNSTSFFSSSNNNKDKKQEILVLADKKNQSTK